MRRQCGSWEKEIRDVKGELGTKKCFPTPFTFSLRILWGLTSCFPTLHGSVGASNHCALPHGHRDGWT